MKRSTYLELGKRSKFGRPVKKPVGPVPPAPDPKEVADFDLGTWRVRPSLARMTRADRLVALDGPTLATLLCLVEAPPEGVNRDELAVRVFGPGEHDAKLKRCTSQLRRIFSEDGSVRLENVPGDAYVLAVGEPIPGRGLRGAGDALMAPLPNSVEERAKPPRRRVTAALAAVAVVAALASLLAWLANRGNTVALGEVVRVAPLAAEPGDELSPSFSPDGRQFVYAWKKPGTEFTKLWIRAVGGDAPRPLTTGIRDDVFPAWSPSGNLVAFQRVDGPQCEVFVIRPDGRDETKIADCSVDAVGQVEWSAAGNAVVYAYRTAPALPTQLVSVTVADEKMVGVTNPAMGQPGDSWPAISQSGARMAFQRSRSVGVADLMLLDSATGTPERLTYDGVPTYGSAWEPGNRSLVYASPRSGRSELWRSTLDGRPAGLLVAAPRADLRAPVMSNDGRQLAYERWTVRTRLLAVPLTTDLDQPPAPWLPETAAYERDAQLSPDRSRVAFVSDRGGRDQLWLAEADGRDPKPLGNLELDHLQAPRWSPDGGSIVLAGSRGGATSLWVVAVADGRTRRVDVDGDVQAPSFSRDGQWLYYASRATGRWEIWRRAWPEGRPEQVTADGGWAALESRDGSELYFVRPDRNGLWKRSREPGGDDTLVTPALFAGDWNNWLVTEDAVWFVTRPDRENAQLAKYSLQSEATELVRPLPNVLPRSGLTLSGDGRAVIVAQVARTDVDIEMATLE